MAPKPTVLVVCTGNSMRSQIAEGLLRLDLGDRIDVFSAGTHPSHPHPVSMLVLRELGIDTSAHRSKSVVEFLNRRIDLVITVCDSASEACPAFPGASRIIHKGYPDPVNSREAGNLEDFMRDLRDQMRTELREIVVRELAL